MNALYKFRKHSKDMIEIIKIVMKIEAIGSKRKLGGLLKKVALTKMRLRVKSTRSLS